MGTLPARCGGAVSTRPRYPRARLSPAKDELLAIAVSHTSVIEGDVAPLVARLDALVASRAQALRWEGRVTFFFEGWDDDPRETAEIPEIRAYFARATEAAPYWLHLGEKTGDTLLHVLRLLTPGHREALREGLVGWRFDDLRAVMTCVTTLFNGMNALHERLGIDDAVNERITEEVAQLIENALQ